MEDEEGLEDQNTIEEQKKQIQDLTKEKQELELKIENMGEEMQDLKNKQEGLEKEITMKVMSQMGIKYN